MLVRSTYGNPVPDRQSDPHRTPPKQTMTAAIPPARVLAGMLANSTEILAHELVNPTLRSPDWSDAQWRVARAVSAMHGISGLLAGRLRWRDAPSTWCTFLADQWEQTATRQRRLDEILQTVDCDARERGIPLLTMKGSALRRLGLYAPGERPMADLDLLARHRDVDRAASMLRSLGFREGPVTTRDRTFEPTQTQAPAPLGECATNSVKIELHWSATGKLPLREVDATEIVFPETSVSGLQGYPSRAALMLHLILHTAENMVVRSLRLLQLHDIAHLSAHLTELDWEEVLRLSCITGENAWWIYPPLALTERYVAPVPLFVLRQARAGCPRLLVNECRRKRLTDLSRSHPWLAPFPAIRWARSVPEAVRYVSGRLFHNELSATRKVAFDANPILANSDWMRLSRAHRVIRWMSGRVPRVATLASVEAAFADPH